MIKYLDEIIEIPDSDNLKKFEIPAANLKAYPVIAYDLRLEINTEIAYNTPCRLTALRFEDTDPFCLVAETAVP